MFTEHAAFRVSKFGFKTFESKGFKMVESMAPDGVRQKA